MKLFMLTALLFSATLAISACTTREMATGAAAAGAGYVVGKEVEKDDD